MELHAHVSIVIQKSESSSRRHQYGKLKVNKGPLTERWLLFRNLVSTGAGSTNRVGVGIVESGKIVKNSRVKVLWVDFIHDWIEPTNKRTKEGDTKLQFVLRDDDLGLGGWLYINIHSIHSLMVDTQSLHQIRPNINQ